MRKSLVLLAVLLVPPLASCGEGEPSAAAPSAGAASASASPKRQFAAQPKTEAAVRKVAQEEFDAYAAGEYGEAWDLWTAAGKKMISKTNYEKLHELCKSVTGLRFTIEKVRVSGNIAAVRVSRSIAVLSYKFLYEQGQWRFVPDKDSVTEYRYARKAGLAKLVARRKAEGSCMS